MTSSRLVAPELTTIDVHGHTREAFLLRATLAVGATYGAFSATPYITKALAQDGGGDVDILNFALTLEYLESTFYETGVDDVDGLSEKEKKLAEKLRDDENAHVDALTDTIKKLGGKPVKKPTFDFGKAFGSRSMFLQVSNQLEDTGVSAYNAAAPNIKSVEVLAAAGGIVQVEARHSALIRLARNKPPAPRAFDKASDEAKVRKAVKPFIKP